MVTAPTATFCLRFSVMTYAGASGYRGAMVVDGVRLTDLVRDVKARLVKGMTKAPDELCFVLRAEELNEDFTLADCGICEETVPAIIIWYSDPKALRAMAVEVGVSSHLEGATQAEFAGAADISASPSIRGGGPDRRIVNRAG